jgi:amidase
MSAVATFGPLARTVEDVAAVLAELGHDVQEGAPDWDDERMPRAWMTAGGAGMRRIAAMLERLHGRPLDPDALEPATRGLLIEMPAIPGAAAAEAERALEAYTQRVLADWPPDGILVTPTLARLPLPIGGLPSQAGVTSESVRFSVFVRPFNVTGQPAITIPVEDTIGVQIVGPPGRGRPRAGGRIAGRGSAAIALQTGLPSRAKRPCSARVERLSGARQAS